MPNKWQFIAIGLLIVMFVNNVNCDCGRPHRPAFGGHSRRGSQRFKEDSVIEYYCNDSYRLVFNRQRVCKLGLWTGRPAVCAKPIESQNLVKELIIISDSIKVHNISGSYDNVFYVWNSKDNKSCITSNSSRQQNWTFILNKPEVISYFIIKLKNNLFLNESVLANSVKAFLINNKQIKVNRYQKRCTLLQFNSNNELEFVCNSMSVLKKKFEESDQSNEIGIYQFPHNCGRIGLPLEMTVERLDEVVELEASCQDGYQLIGNSKIICGSDGQWTGSPSCRPITTCPLITPINKFDERVVRIEYKNPFYFNQTLMAVNETDAIHHCFKFNTSSNKSFTRNVVKYIRQCEGGHWSQVDTDCDTILIDNELIENSFNDNNYYAIIITMLVMVVMFLLLIAVSYYILKYKNRRKPEEIENRSTDSGNKLIENNQNFLRYTRNRNRISDPCDDSIYSMVADESYDIFSYGSQLNATEQYDDTQVPKPLYLEILPLSELNSGRSSSQSFY